MLKLISRAEEIEKASKTMMVKVPEFDTKFPPVKAFRAALINSELNYAGLYAAKAISFAKSGYVKEAKKHFQLAERSYSRYEWARDASGKDIYLYEVDWYQATRI